MFAYRLNQSVAHSAWSEANEPRVATAQPPDSSGYRIPSDPSSLSLTCTGADRSSGAAPGWPWLKNLGYGRATTSPVSVRQIRPRQVRVTSVQAFS